MKKLLLFLLLLSTLTQVQAQQIQEIPLSHFSFVDTVECLVIDDIEQYEFNYPLYGKGRAYIIYFGFDYKMLFFPKSKQLFIVQVVNNKMHQLVCERIEDLEIAGSRKEFIFSERYPRLYRKYKTR